MADRSKSRPAFASAMIDVISIPVDRIIAEFREELAPAQRAMLTDEVIDALRAQANETAEAELPKIVDELKGDQRPGP